MAEKVTYIVGTDVGGTCTDCVVLDETGRTTLGKALSTPPDFSEGILDAVRIAAEELGLELDSLIKQTSLFLHATTMGENAIVDGTIAKAGLITTAGHRETLFAMRGGYGRWSGLTDDEKRDPIYTEKPVPLIPLDMIRDVEERIDHNGHILRPLNEKELESAIEDLVESGAETLGVCFLWSFRNPTHERAVRDVVRRLYPNLFVTLSSEVAPLVGEYERTATVALNSCLYPPVSTYLNSLEQKLRRLDFGGTLLVMQAYGGLLAKEEASARAVGIIESGPVSGLVGSKATGKLIGIENVIATDMGGTTFKMGVVRKGMIEYQREPNVLRYHYLLPKMDVVSLGAAGGSVIWIDSRLGIPRVGPMSAGSYPGPVCYDIAGEEPTITDVDLILGYLDPRFFLGGRKPLNREKAIRVFEEKIAKPLRMDTIEAAAAIYNVANNMIYDLIHKTTVQRGLDPRGYGLLAFGGTAGMHAGTWGEMLSVDRIVIPNTASVQGAFGLVSSDVVHEYQLSKSVFVPADVDEVNRIYGDLEKKAMAALRAEGFAREKTVIDRSVDMLYGRQVHVVTTPLEKEGLLTEKDLEGTYNRFERLYEEKYGQGSAYREAGMIISCFRLRATGLIQKPNPFRYELAEPNPEKAFIGKKDVYFEKTKAVLDTSIFDFQKLSPGNVIMGPSIILTPITTIVVLPHHKAYCDEFKNIVMTYKES
jgi:N-methylhydantoinase A